MQSVPMTRTILAAERRGAKPGSISRLTVTRVPGGNVRSACNSMPPRLRSSVFPLREACGESIDTLRRSLMGMKLVCSQTRGRFRAVGERGRFHPCRAKDFPKEFAGECIVVNDKNLCRHVIVPHVAH